MRTVSFKLSKALDRRLAALARQRKTSRSALLREAIELYAANPAQSVTAAAAELVGALRGPGDLSSSSRHVAGYGD